MNAATISLTFDEEQNLRNHGSFTHTRPSTSERLQVGGNVVVQCYNGTMITVEVGNEPQRVDEFTHKETFTLFDPRRWRRVKNSGLPYMDPPRTMAEFMSDPYFSHAKAILERTGRRNTVAGGTEYQGKRRSVYLDKNGFEYWKDGVIIPLSTPEEVLAAMRECNSDLEEADVVRDQVAYLEDIEHH